MKNIKSLPSPPNEKTGWPWTEETDPSLYREPEQYPKISIVMPTYNQGQYIEEAIRSLLLQNYPNLEFIIMDGGSNDDTVSVIKKYEPWINYWRSGKDNGQSDAINKGLSKCTGDWFNWLNSDDYFLPGAFFSFAEEIIKSKEAPVAVCGEKCVETLEGKVLKLPENKKNRFYEDFVGMGYYQAAALFNTDKVRMFGGVDESLHYTMDIKLVMQMNLVGETRRVNKDVFVARSHAESKGVSQAAKFYKEWIIAYASLLNYFPEDYLNIPLIQKIEKVTGISFKRASAQEFKPSRFTADQFRQAQLYLGERIVHLMYGNHKPGLNELIGFYKKNYPAYYKQAKMGFIRFKNTPVIQMGLRIRNSLFR